MSLTLIEAGILAAGLEKSALIIEAVWFSRQDGPQIKAKAVDPGLLRPVAQTIGHHLDYPRVAKVQRVSGAGVVDVIARVVGEQAVITCVIDSLERECRAAFVSLRGVVIHHVQNDLDPGIVKARDHLLELAQVRAFGLWHSAYRGRKNRYCCSPSNWSSPFPAGCCH